MTLFIKKEREFIVEEKDVTSVLTVVNREAKFISYHIGNCGWANHPNKWFITFYATDKKYGRIMKGLTENGKFTVDVRPGGQVDLWFEKN